MTTYLIVGAILAAWAAGFCHGRLSRVKYKTVEAKVIEVIPPDFVHKSFIEDPEHYDEHGHYLWWGD